MDASKKNRLVAKLASAKHFDRDKEHFKKVFPGSPLNADLDRAQPFSKKGLDERMLYELLNHVCYETILEFRGVLPERDKKQKDIDALAAAQKKVLEADNVDEFDYSELKSLAKGLQLDTPDLKKATLISAIESYKETMADGDDQGGDNEPNAPANDQGDGDDQGGDNEPNAPAGDQGDGDDQNGDNEPNAPANDQGDAEEDKKKEGQKSNTQA